MIGVRGMSEPHEYMESVGWILRAVHFAAIKHSGQKRKGKDHSPYINHPIQVAMTLWEQGGVRDPIILQAAILHDTLEDTETTFDELSHGFGKQVASIVREVTDDKSLPKAVRKQMQIEHAASLTREAKLVKLADKICNIQDVVNDSPHDWDHSRRVEYLDWAEKVVERLSGVHPGLERLFFESLQQGREILNS
jgi:guanosine-3',5'-bis(diphosphate) 3'-pyrophosphohydrolase